MTKEQIIGALKAAAKPYEEYYIDDEVMEAINTYSNPYEFVAPDFRNYCGQSFGRFWNAGRTGIFC